MNKYWTAIAAATALGTIAGIAAATPPAQAAADGAVVATDKGSVRGTVAKDHREFLGIPYAAPPVGKLRWASPRPAAAWKTVRNATKPGNRCAQQAGLLSPTGEKESTTEDCLYLNVTTPRHAPKGKKLPVMVWIHGSGFRNGAGALYRPAEMVARDDVIVVTVNYRLGMFGFLAHRAFDKAGNGSGNFGLEDQQAAMRWVQRNAGAFGGDARNVTIFGESAGGVSTCSQLVSPQSAGLFQRAIVQSGPCTRAPGDWPEFDGSRGDADSWLPHARPAAERLGKDVAAKLGCPDPATAASCLRALPVQKVLKESGYGFTPTYGGGGVLPTAPNKAYATGKFHRVPVMQGITRDEYRLFQALGEEFSGEKLDKAGYESHVKAYVGAKRAPEVLKRYTLKKYGSYSVAWSAIVTDASFGRASTEQRLALQKRVPTYSFEFADASAPLGRRLQGARVPHGRLPRRRTPLPLQHRLLHRPPPERPAAEAVPPDDGLLDPFRPDRKPERPRHPDLAPRPVRPVPLPQRHPPDQLRPVPRLHLLAHLLTHPSMPRPPGGASAVKRSFRRNSPTSSAIASVVYSVQVWVSTSSRSNPRCDSGSTP
ncbi:carboxylesterase/lipase family protein [Actinomadura rupiterrae]|uniref:carboxylesterase/lipase family protein n=1 Tax=Actinomadura rupiterrae TaxID=559627 RepID=UPI0020A52553|nr:carboxylesterase family protein [Actinomadura rupiterrae]MCP2340287.1 para-nitrobenzyl esterase [Actinomadura rupiterrae]